MALKAHCGQVWMDEQSSEGPDPHSTKYLRDQIFHNDQRKSRADWREIVVGRFAFDQGVICWI
jgi:hypothetical protein